MTTFRKNAFTTCLLQAALLAAPCLADEGRTPIFQPTTISQPGDYIVTQNISGSGSSVISISTSGRILLDLNGFTLTATGGNTMGISVSAGGDLAEVVIKHGRISGGWYGISYNTQPQIRGRLRLEDLTVSGTTYSAITASTPASIEMVDCSVTADDTFAVSIYNPNATGSFTGRFLRNRITNLSAAGNSVALALDGLRGAEIRGNIVIASAGSAARLNGPNGGANVLSENTFVGGAGLTIGSSIGADNNLVIDNTIRSTANNYCLQIGSAGNRLAGNVIGPGCTDGIVFVYNSTVRNLIEGNQIQGNGGCGLRFAFGTANAYRNNMLRGNTGGAVCGVANTDAGGNIP